MNALNPGRLVRIQGCGLTGRVLWPEEQAGIGRYAVLVPVLGQSVTLPADRLVPLSSQAVERLGRRAQRINRDAQEFLDRNGLERRLPEVKITPAASSAPITLNAALNALERQAQLSALAELVVPSSPQ
jgi:hypothetical protein